MNVNKAFKNIYTSSIIINIINVYQLVVTTYNLQIRSKIPSNCTNKLYNTVIIQAIRNTGGLYAVTMKNCFTLFVNNYYKIKCLTSMRINLTQLSKIYNILIQNCIKADYLSQQFLILDSEQMMHVILFF